LSRLNADAKKSLTAATEAYYQQLRDADAVTAYLKRRGLTGTNAQSFRLGAVVEPIDPAHKRFQGRLVIPYVTPAGTVGIKYRCCEDHDCKEAGHGKYDQLSGSRIGMFNVAALSRPEPYICVTEGELDCITAAQAGLPAVGIPGVSAWRPHFSRCLKGYDAVYVLADSDDAGQGIEFARKVESEVRNVSIVSMPPNEDVNSFCVKEGAEALLKWIGLSVGTNFPA
jgi:DNA primase